MFPLQELQPQCIINLLCYICTREIGVSKGLIGW